MDRIELTIFRNLVNNNTFLKRAYPFFKAEYFHSATDRVIFEHIYKYVNTYNTNPTIESLVLSLQADNSIPEKTYTDAVESVYGLHPVEGTQLDWLLKESEEFCKSKAIYNAVARGIKIIDGEDPEFTPSALPTLLSDALSVCFDTNIGHDFYENADERYDHYHREEERLPFDIDYFNKITDNGLPKKTLTCLLAGCVHPDTKVKIRIRKLEEYYEELEVSIKDIKNLLHQYDVEILGADGYVPVVEFVEKGMYEEFVLETDTEKVMVNLDHLFETTNGWVRAEDMVGKSYKVLTEHGEYKSAVVYKTGNIIPIVDIQIDHENHRYYANGVSSHNTNAGKSLVMCHMAAANLSAGKNVLYITMEMSELVTSLRIDANLLDLPISQVKTLGKDKYLGRIGNLKKKTKGKLIVKEYPTSGAHVGHFKTLLNELKLKKNFVPDIIFVDYLNICLSQRVKGGNANSYTIVKSIAEELRGMAVEYDLPIVTATQTTRSGVNSSDLSITDVSESIGLAATVDMLLGVIRTPELDELNQLLFKLLKSRFVDAASYGPFLVGVDRSKMKLYDVEKSAQDGIGHQPRTGPANTQDTPSFSGSSFKQAKGMDFSEFKY